MAHQTREMKHGASNTDAEWGLEMPTSDWNGSDEATSPLLSQQSCDGTERAKARMDGTFSTAFRLSEEDESQPEASELSLRETNDDQHCRKPLTERFDSSHHLFEQERTETYRERGENRFPSQTVMTTVVGENNYGKRLPFLEMSDKMFRWLLAPLNAYDDCNRPSRTAESSSYQGLDGYYLKWLCFLLGYGIILTITVPFLLSYFVVSLSSKMCCGRAAGQKKIARGRSIFSYEGPNPALTDYIGCPWDEYVVLLERTVNDDKDSYSPVKYFATSDIVIIRDNLSWLELRSLISEITVTSYGRLLGIIVYGDEHERRWYQNASECCFIQKFKGLMTIFCNKAKISWRDAKRVGTYHILARAFGKGCFPRDFGRVRDHARGFEEMERRSLHISPSSGTQAAVSVDVNTIPGQCMQNTFFDLLTFVKSVAFLFVSELAIIDLWPIEVDIVGAISSSSLLFLSYFVPGVSPLLCACGRRRQPTLIRSFWGPAKAWLFMDFLFTFQTLQLNIYPFGGAGWQRGCFIFIRRVLIGIAKYGTTIITLRAKRFDPSWAEAQLILFSFVIVFHFWVSLYVDRRYLQSFTGTSKVILRKVVDGTSQSHNVEQGFFAYESAVSEGSFGSPQRISSAQCAARPSQRAHSSKGSMRMNAHDNDDHHYDTGDHPLFFEESSDVITSQILTECRQKSIHVWTRILAMLGGLTAIGIHCLAYLGINGRPLFPLGWWLLLSGTLLGYSINIVIATFGSPVGAYSLSLRLLLQMIQDTSSYNEEVFFSNTSYYVLHTLSKVWPLERNAGYWLSSKCPLYLPSNVYSFLEMWREVVVQCQHDFAENSGVVPATLLTIIFFGGYLLYTWIQGVSPVERGPILFDGLFVIFVFFILLLEASRIERLRNDVSNCLQRWKEEVLKAEQNANGLDSSNQCRELRRAYDALQEVKESIDGCDVGVIAWPGIPLDKRLLYSVLSILVTGIAKLGINIAQSLREGNT